MSGPIRIGRGSHSEVHGLLVPVIGVVEKVSSDGRIVFPREKE